MLAVIDRFCEGQPPQSGPGRRKTYPDGDIPGRGNGFKTLAEEQNILLITYRRSN